MEATTTPFATCLSSLIRVGCIQRLPRAGAATAAAYPVYALVSRNLPERWSRLQARLNLLGGDDIHLITCADRQDVDALSAAERRCLHPEYVVTRRWGHRALGLSNGTISLALKHQIAYSEVVRRGLPAALVVEDDAAVPPDLWRRVSEYAMPADAAVFYLGSYSANPRGGTLHTEPALPGTSPAVHRRRNGTEPHIIGTLAYLVFQRGAKALLSPVRVEADLALSLLGPSRPCGSPCPIRAPREQYGPRQWLVAPDPASRQNSHGSRLQSEVQTGWVAACRAAHRAGRPLNRNCGKVAWRETGGSGGAGAGVAVSTGAGAGAALRPRAAARLSSCIDGYAPRAAIT